MNQLFCQPITLLCALLVLLTAEVGKADDLQNHVIVEDGMARAAIVVGSSKLHMTQAAAEDLRWHLEQASGVKLLLVQEKDADELKGNPVRFVVGDGDEPANLPDPLGLLPDMRWGGYAACGQYALVTRDGGYSFYKPLREGEYNSEIPVYRIPDGPAFRGKPTVRGNTLVACNRIDGDVTVLDITDLKTPRLVRKFKISGNPDLAFIGDGFLMIPAGRQGLIKFEL